MFQYLIQEYNAKERKLSNEEKQEICKIAEEKFASWDYVWGNSPKYEIQRVKKFPFGIVDARLNIRKGQIEECRIFGDFFSAHEIEELEHFLVGKKYEKEALAATMEDSFIGRYFKDLNACEFAAFLSV
jgi:lipoate-protein ligase A